MSVQEGKDEEMRQPTAMSCLGRSCELTWKGWGGSPGVAATNR